MYFYLPFQFWLSYLQHRRSKDNWKQKITKTQIQTDIQIPPKPKKTLQELAWKSVQEFDQWKTSHAWEVWVQVGIMMKCRTKTFLTSRTSTVSFQTSWSLPEMNQSVLKKFRNNKEFVYFFNFTHCGVIKQSCQKCICELEITTEQFMQECTNV